MSSKVSDQPAAVAGMLPPCKGKGISSGQQAGAPKGSVSSSVKAACLPVTKVETKGAEPEKDRAKRKKNESNSKSETKTKEGNKDQAGKKTPKLKKAAAKKTRKAQIVPQKTPSPPRKKVVTKAKGSPSRGSRGRKPSSSASSSSPVSSPLLDRPLKVNADRVQTPVSSPLQTFKKFRKQARTAMEITPPSKSTAPSVTLCQTPKLDSSSASCTVRSTQVTSSSTTSAADRPRPQERRTAVPDTPSAESTAVLKSSKTDSEPHSVVKKEEPADTAEPLRSPPPHGRRRHSPVLPTSESALRPYTPDDKEGLAEAEERRRRRLVGEIEVEVNEEDMEYPMEWDDDESAEEEEMNIQDELDVDD